MTTTVVNKIAGIPEGTGGGGADTPETLTNKTVDLGDNTITGTTTEFNTALSDDNFAFVGATNLFSRAQTLQPSQAETALTVRRATSGQTQDILMVQAQDNTVLAKFDKDGKLTAPALRIPGSSSGVVTLQTAAAAGTYALTLPTSDGDADQVLITDGNGVLSWSTLSTPNERTMGSFSWDASQSSPAALGGVMPQVTTIHKGMRRCVVNDSGVVQYYLSATDSTKKADGSAATLTGADGVVMVEIPKFYTKREVVGNVTTWSISAFPLTGYTVHPAFVKAGVEVAYRYVGAYDACYWDATDSTYKSGLNLDDLTASLDLAADKLASVAGVYPVVGVTRAECRTLAANRGTGWHQLDFALYSAIQLLYLIEYQSFYSQSILGAGNTVGSYTTSSTAQTDSPHTIAGASNARGNGSTNTTTGAGVNAKPGTSYMSYRGIENWYGNCWSWADGINVNVTSNGNVYITNDYRNFADDTATGHTLVTSSASTAQNYASAIAAIDNYFIATSVSGGSASTYLTDYWYGSTSSNRVVRVGGTSADGAGAGGFRVGSNDAASFSSRDFGARLAF